jgi:hypothetical protein
MSEQFVTRTGLVGELRDLGVLDGGVVTVHTKMRARLGGRWHAHGH